MKNRLEGINRGEIPSGQKLGELLTRTEILRVPGTHDALFALMAKKAGFEAVYLSGAALSASRGLPDLGLLTTDDLCIAVHQINRATGLPVIVDGDTGHGGVLNVMKLVTDLESAGAAALQLEDQSLPKKCGHLSHKQLIPAKEFATKINAAVKARTHMLIIARTDAAQYGMDETMARLCCYRDAGADVVFPEALTEREQFRRVVEEIGIPVLANMTEFGRSPMLTAKELEELGCRLVIWPASSLRVASRSVEGFYADLFREGTTRGMLDRMQTRKELYDFLGYHEYEELDSAIERSIIPPS